MKTLKDKIKEKAEKHRKNIMEEEYKNTIIRNKLDDDELKEFIKDMIDYHYQQSIKEITKTSENGKFNCQYFIYSDGYSEILDKKYLSLAHSLSDKLKKDGFNVQYPKVSKTPRGVDEPGSVYLSIYISWE